VLTSEETVLVEPDEALRIGLVTDVVDGGPVLDRALEWTHDVAANCSPRSLAAMKEQIYGDLDHTFTQSIEDMLARMHESFTWGDLPEALQARAESRPPQFPGLK
jgi:enoyl-CoA hydratase/carnithine racemase